MRRRAAFRINGSRLLLIVVLIVLWQVISDVGHLSLYMSSPTAVLSKLITWFNDGTLGTAVGVTLEESVIGYVIGGVIGAIFGFILGRIEFVGKVLDPILLALYAVPKIALAPLFVLWLGIGIVTKISVAALLVFFLVFYNTYAGTKQIDERLCDQARLMGANRWDVMSKLVIPQAAAWCFVGLRIALPYSLTGAVVGEFISSTEGIGYEINNATATFDTAGVFAGARPAHRHRPGPQHDPRRGREADVALEPGVAAGGRRTRHDLSAPGAQANVAQQSRSANPAPHNGHDCPRWALADDDSYQISVDKIFGSRSTWV